MRGSSREKRTAGLTVADDSGGHADTLADAAASPLGFLGHVCVASVPDARLAATAGESACNNHLVLIYGKKVPPALSVPAQAAIENIAFRLWWSPVR
jgi:hypothetical protein